MRRDAAVIVVGAGPVGMTMAMDLASRGIDVIVVERRQADEPANAKCNTVSARTMETFRRLGIADEVRAAGLPSDYPTDVVFATQLAGWEIGRIRLPSRTERLSEESFPDSDWPTPEPVTRISQMWLEPIMQRKLLTCGNVQFLPATEFVSFSESSEKVTVNVREADGRFRSLTGRYLVGCDGARSAVRKALGIRFAGDDNLNGSQSTLIRADLLRLIRGRPGWMYFLVHPRRRGMVVAIDGEKLWLVHKGQMPGAEPVSDAERLCNIRELLGADDDFPMEIVHKDDWTGRRMVAERARQGRVFICGDAAHIWLPFAGYGMNSGIADAENLSWQLAAVLQGWAPEALLDAYEAERLPILDQVSKHAVGLAVEYMRQTEGGVLPESLADVGLSAEAERIALGTVLTEMNRPQFACAGLNFGYFYDRSPIIAYDGVPPPAYTMDEYTPSTTPGCRVPHVWLSEGVSLYDRLGQGYTLLRLDAKVDVSALVDEANLTGVPLSIIDIPPGVARKVRDLYGEALVLVRPDRHVAWRGDALPLDAKGLIDVVRGASSAVPDGAGRAETATGGVS